MSHSCSVARVGVPRTTPKSPIARRARVARRRCDRARALADDRAKANDVNDRKSNAKNSTSSSSSSARDDGSLGMMPYDPGADVASDDDVASEGSPGGRFANDDVAKDDRSLATPSLVRSNDPFAQASDVASARLRARMARVNEKGNGGGEREANARADEVAWRATVKKFDEYDVAASAMEALECQLEDAVVSEEYHEAASLKKAIDGLRERDATGKCCEAYARAIAEERFADAARYRDAGVGLCGWWAGTEIFDDEGDGEECDGRSVAALDGEEKDGDARSTSSNPLGVIMRVSREHGRLVGSTYSSRDLADIVELHKAYPRGYDYDAGQPVLEIAVEEDPQSPTGFKREVIRLNYIPATITVEDGEGTGFGSEDGDEAKAALGEAIDELSAAVEEFEEEALGSQRAQRADIESVKDEIKATLLSLGPQASIVNSDGEAIEVFDKFDDFDDDDDDDEDDEDEMLYDIKRSPAAIELEGVHAFVLTSVNESVAVDQVIEKPFSSVIDRELEEFLANKWEDMATTDDQPKSHTFGAGESAKLVDAVKEAAQEMFATREEEDYLTEIIIDGVEDDDDDVAEDADDAEDEDEDEDVSAADLLELLGQESVLHTPLPTRVRFNRIPPTLASGKTGDIFDGLYIGAFGPHGPEVLRMVRGRWGDDVGESNDCVTAIKLTGDENVPCGAASFRAKVNKANKVTDGVSSYPEELGVLARYKGEGRVAKPGFSDSHWVDGELLVLNGKGGSLTGGAELGFVWAVPGERRLLILFSSLALPEVEISRA